MINEKIFMANRLFRIFLEQNKIDAKTGNKIFHKYGIWNYIDQTYDVLHLNGDESALLEIMNIIKNRGTVL